MGKSEQVKDVKSPKVYEIGSGSCDVVCDFGEIEKCFLFNSEFGNLDQSKCQNSSKSSKSVFENSSCKECSQESDFEIEVRTKALYVEDFEFENANKSVFSAVGGACAADTQSVGGVYAADNQSVPGLQIECGLGDLSLYIEDPK